MAQHNLFLIDDRGQMALNSITNPVNDYRKILDYTPRTPEEDHTWGGSDPLYGDILMESRYKNVVESAQLLVAFPTRDQFRTWLQLVEAFFVRAKTYAQRKVGSPGFVQHSPEGSAEVPYRSQILSGRVDLAAGTMGLGWRNSAFEITLTWTRRFYWEGEQEIAWMGRNNSGLTQGFVTLYNHTDSGHMNYIDLYAGVAGSTYLSGVLPTPLIIEEVNTYSAALGEQYLSVWSGPPDPDLFKCIWEIEGNPGVTQQPGAANAALYSGGFYGESIPAPLNVETKIFQIELSAGDITATQGRNFRVLTKMINGSEFVTNTRYRLAMMQAGEYVWFGPYQQTQDNPLGAGSDWNEYVDWGVAQLPPFPVSPLGTIAPLILEFRVIPPATKAYQADYVTILPVNSIRRYWHTNAGGIANTWVVIDDGVADLLYVDVPSIGQTKQIRAIGRLLVAFPGEYNRLYFAAMQPNGTAHPLHSVSVRISYRPRRLTI